MKLLYSPLSPFVRKVMIVAIENGLDGRIEKVTEATNPSVPNPAIAKHNPLMKIPALVTDDGLELIESKVIVQYLDALGGGKLIPASGNARWKALRWKFFRLHFQYMCAFDNLPGRRNDYDYFRITAGPLTLGARYRGRVASKSRIERALSGHRSVA